MEQIKQYGIRRIREEIPRFILNNVFLKPDYGMGFMGQAITLESAINAAVIDNAILMDLMLIDGKEETIDLRGLLQQPNADGTVLITVPIARTGGRELLEVYRIIFGPNDYQGQVLGNPVSDVDRKLGAIQLAAGHIPVTSTTECSIVGPNMILVDMYGVNPMMLSAEVNIAIGNNLEHVPAKAYELFGSLCVARCQQYIYNETIINMNRGFIDRGKELGSFKDEVMEFKDSGKNYRDLLKKWSKQAFFMDKNKVSKFLKLITPSIM